MGTLVFVTLLYDNNDKMAKKISLKIDDLLLLLLIKVYRCDDGHPCPRQIVLLMALIFIFIFIYIYIYIYSDMCVGWYGDVAEFIHGFIGT
jgi:hypothetical protein